ncbi:MAG: HEAT repeat domain-containing protein [Gemmataceae bacterium]
MELDLIQLTLSLRHDDVAVRVYAATMLGWLGSDAEPAVPTLIELLRHADCRDRRMAALALGNIGPAASAAIEPLLDLVNDDEDDGVREMAAEALELIDPDCESQEAA